MGATDQNSRRPLAQERNNRTLFYLGVALLFLGVLMPALLTVDSVKLYDTIREAIYQEQEIYILLAALKLVMLNAVRAYPHYLGVFFLVESLEGLSSRKKTPLALVMVCVTIPGIYMLIEWIYGIHYDFGIPAVSMITVMTVLAKIDFSFVNFKKKAMMVAFLITSLQFLDMMPGLWRFHFGRGESSYDIKLAAAFLRAEQFLQAMSTIFFALLLFMAVLLLMLVVDENNIRRISEQKERDEHMLMDSRMCILENRTYMELQHLVHDLKSPLTSMQTLVGVVKLSCAQRGETMESGYLEKIEDAIERMSSMISEILYEERRTVVTTQDLLNGMMAQISAAEYADLIHTDNRAPQTKIKVNQIRFSRVLVNLIENAAYAVQRPEGAIHLKVDTLRMDWGPAVRFVVRDNGSGIAREKLGEIWEKGFSGRNSSGFGLSFVAEVVRQSSGTVTLDSVEQEGTVVTITLPQYEEEQDEQE